MNNTNLFENQKNLDNSKGRKVRLKQKFQQLKSFSKGRREIKLYLIL